MNELSNHTDRFLKGFQEHKDLEGTDAEFDWLLVLCLELYLKGVAKDEIIQAAVDATCQISDGENSFSADMLKMMMSSMLTNVFSLVERARSLNLKELSIEDGNGRVITTVPLNP